MKKRKIINVPRNTIKEGKVVKAGMDDVVFTSILHPGEKVKIAFTPQRKGWVGIEGK